MASSEQGGLTYGEVGGTRGVMPADYRHLEQQRPLGTGEDVFRLLAERLMSWGIQRGAGLRVHAGSDRAATGVTVSIRLGVGPLAVSAPCRVVYTVEEPRRVGFAYGTLQGHPESGEELFLLEHEANDQVVLTIKAFSRPARWFSRFGAPASRLAQRAITARYLRALNVD